MAFITDTLTSVDESSPFRQQVVAKRRKQGIFISYYHTDEVIATKLFFMLSREFPNVWFDTQRLKVGDYNAEIASAIGEAKVFIPVLSPTYSPDGSRIVSASRDETIKVWDANNFREIYSWELPLNCNDASFSSDGRTIAVACLDGNIYLIDLPPLQELIDQTRERFKNNPLTPKERRQYYLE